MQLPIFLILSLKMRSSETKSKPRLKNLEIRQSRYCAMQSSSEV